MTDTTEDLHLRLAIDTVLTLRRLHQDFGHLHLPDLGMTTTGRLRGKVPPLYSFIISNVLTQLIEITQHRLTTVADPYLLHLVITPTTLQARKHPVIGSLVKLS